MVKSILIKERYFKWLTNNVKHQLKFKLSQTPTEEQLWLTASQRIFEYNSDGADLAKQFPHMFTKRTKAPELPLLQLMLISLNSYQQHTKSKPCQLSWSLRVNGIMLSRLLLEEVKETLIRHITTLHHPNDHSYQLTFTMNYFNNQQYLLNEKVMKYSL